MMIRPPIPSHCQLQTTKWLFLTVYSTRRAGFGQIRLFSSNKNSRNLIINLDSSSLKKSSKNTKSIEQKHFENRRKGGKRIQWSTGSVAMLMLPAFAFSLGCWQVYRLRWKLGIIENLKSKLNQEAVDLPDDLSRSSLDPLEYCRVRISGEFLHNREFVINPRGRFDPGQGTSASVGSMLSENNMSSHGGHLITPFRLQKSGKVILINRGWIPTSLFDVNSRKDVNPKGVVELEAIVRKTETRPQFVGQNIPEKGAWYYRDIDQMAETHGTLPVWLDAAYESTIPGGPIGGQTNIKMRNEHVQYLTTWYTLTIVTLLMWLHKFRR